MQQVGGDAWCSSGGLAADGTLVSSGGFLDGGKTLRYIGGGCQDCEWREYDNTLAEDRWYVLYIYLHQIHIFVFFLICVTN